MLILFLILALLSFSLNVYLLMKKRHYDGQIVVNKFDGKVLYSLELDRNPDEIHKMSVVIFKVANEENPIEEIVE